MCLGFPMTRTFTLIGMSTWPAGSFCLCCFWQVVKHLWSLHMSGIPHHTHLHPGRNIYLTSRFILSVLFWQEVRHVWSLHMSGICCDTDLHPSRNLYLTSWFILSVMFWQAMRCLWSLHMSRIPHHTDLHPSRNVLLTSWFILSVLFLTGGETSVIPTYVRDPPSHRPLPWWECVLHKLFHSFCVVFDRWWDICGPTCVPDPPSHRPQLQYQCLPNQLVHTVCVIFDRRWDICGPCKCPGYNITQISTLVGMSTWPAGSFCLCCFWQVVKCLWSLQVSGLPRHTDLHPSRNVYLTSWFILSVLFLTGSETSVVDTHVWDMRETDLHPSRNAKIISWIILSVLFFHRQWDICGPYICPEFSITHNSLPW